MVGTSEFDRTRKILVPTSVRRASRTLDLANQLVEADDLVAYRRAELSRRGAEGVRSTIRVSRRSGTWTTRGQVNGLAADTTPRALGAWSKVGGGKRSIVIAIIDDGIDLNHPDLKANIWNNPSRTARDRHGRDFVDDSDPFNPSPKVFNAPFNDTDINDIHGTPCAGVAAAVGNNAKGVSGIAWNCRLMAVKILAGPSLAPDDRIADAIRYAAQYADVLSCSWGLRRIPDIESAINYATDARTQRPRIGRLRGDGQRRTPLGSGFRRRMSALSLLVPATTADAGQPIATMARASISSRRATTTTCAVRASRPPT